MVATQPGLALLRTCKTIHEEASSVLYQNNTFVVTEIASFYSPFTHFGFSWLSELSNYAHLLRHLEVDVNLFRYIDPKTMFGYSSLDYIDLAPLVFALCRGECFVQGQLLVNVSLIYTDVEVDAEGDDLPSLVKWETDGTKSKSNAIPNLVVDDASYFRTYGRAIYHVGFAIDGTSVIIVWAISPREYGCKYPYHDGDLTAYPEKWLQKTLGGPMLLVTPDRFIPTSLVDYIILNAITFEATQKLSVKNAGNIIQAVQPLLAHRDALEQYSQEYAMRNVFDIEFETHHSSTDFTCWEAIGRLIRFTNQPYHDSVQNSVDWSVQDTSTPWHLGTMKQASISIVFYEDITQSLTLAKVSFEAMPLLYFTAYTTDDTIITVRVAQDDRDHEGERSTRLTQKEFRRTMLEAFTTYKVTYSDGGNDPKIWLDGEGKVVEVTSTTYGHGDNTEGRAFLPFDWEWKEMTTLFSLLRECQLREESATEEGSGGSDALLETGEGEGEDESESES